MMNYKRKIFKLIALITFVVISLDLQAQVLNPVSWDFSVRKISKADSELVLTATINRGWHLYSQNIPDGGPVPTTFKIEKGTGFFLIGKVVEPKATEVFDKQFNMNVKYFSDKAEFIQKVKIMSDKPVIIKGVLEFMCCNDESCLPPSEVPFEFTLPPSK